MPYIHFSDQEKEQARRADIVDFLQSQGEKVVRTGKEWIWESPTGRVSIRGNLFYHQYERQGGNIIDFCNRFYGMDYQQAMEAILGHDPVRYQPDMSNLKIKKIDRSPDAETAGEKKELSIPNANPNMRRVYAYLLKARHLDREIVDYFVKNRLLYEDFKHHNAVFVGRDENGEIRHLHMRGTLSGSTFKGNREGSDAQYSFHYIGSSPRLYCFEAPIDMLSFISLNKDNWKEHSYTSLCSTGMDSVMHLLQTYPNLQEVVMCLDHDPAGIEGNIRIGIHLKQMGYKVRKRVPQNKDWNEDLRATKGCTPIPAKEHPGKERMKEIIGEFVKDVEKRRVEINMSDYDIKTDELVQALKKKLDDIRCRKIRTVEDALSIKPAALDVAQALFFKAQWTWQLMPEGFNMEEYMLRFYPLHLDKGNLDRHLDLVEEEMELLKSSEDDAELAVRAYKTSTYCLTLYKYIDETAIKMDRELAEKKNLESESEPEPEPEPESCEQIKITMTL